MYTLKFHNDINFSNMDIPYNIVKEDKVITTGYDDFVKMEDWTKNLEINDTVIVRLLSIRNARLYPNKPFLLKCKCIYKGQDILGNLDTHMDELIPDIRNDKTRTYKNKRHPWFDTWEERTKVFCVKIDDITEEYTYNQLKDVINEEQYQDFNKPFRVANGRTFVRYF